MQNFSKRIENYEKAHTEATNSIFKDNLYLGCECFHKDTNGRTNSLAEGVAALMRKFFPWSSCNYLLFVGRK